MASSFIANKCHIEMYQGGGSWWQANTINWKTYKSNWYRKGCKSLNLMVKLWLDLGIAGSIIKPTDRDVFFFFLCQGDWKTCLVTFYFLSDRQKNLFGHYSVILFLSPPPFLPPMKKRKTTIVKNSSVVVDLFLRALKNFTTCAKSFLFFLMQFMVLESWGSLEMVDQIWIWFKVVFCFQMEVVMVVNLLSSLVQLQNL